MKSLKFKRAAAALALSLGAVAGSASAAVLTFDNLTAMIYGDGEPLLASMSAGAQTLSYVEAGYQLTLHTPNASGTAHISDGTFLEQTFNWHDGIDNGTDTYVTLSKVGGGLFNLTGFNYYTGGNTVSADGNQVGVIAEGEGFWDMALNGITELRFSSSAYNELDNIAVEDANGAVPLPGTLPLLLSAALAAGALVRRRRS